jgi:site-specific recombinase XerC
MYHHGLRVSEACQLKVTDIDIQAKRINRLKKVEQTSQPMYNGHALHARSHLMTINIHAAQPALYGSTVGLTTLTRNLHVELHCRQLGPAPESRRANVRGRKHEMCRASGSHSRLVEFIVPKLLHDLLRSLPANQL